MTFKKNLKTLGAGLLLSTALAVPGFAEGYDFSNYRGGYTTDGDFSVFGFVSEKDFKFGNGIETSIAGGFDVEDGFGTSTEVFAVGTLGYNLGSNITPYVRLGFLNRSGDFFDSQQTSYGAGIDWRSEQFALGVEYRKFDFEFGEDETAQFAGIYSPTDTVDVYLGALKFIDDDFTLYSLGTDLQFGGFGANLGLLMDEDFFEDALLQSRFEYGFEPGDSLFGPSSILGNKFYVFAGVFGPLDDLGDGNREYGIGMNINDYTRVDLSYLDYPGCTGCDEDISLFVNYQMGKKRLRVIDEFNDAAVKTLPNAYRSFAFSEYYGSIFD